MVSSLIVGAVMLVIGAILRLARIQRNSLFGYRTFLSMKDDANWHYANRVSGLYAIIIAFMCFVLAYLAYQDIIPDRYCAFIFMTLILAMIITTEVQLRKFDKEKSRIGK